MDGGIEIRFCNWKALIFTSILLASKFWEDINYWNKDYVEGLNFYTLKSINTMENVFVSLCAYHFFVSAEDYAKYNMAVREVNNPLIKNMI